MTNYDNSKVYLQILVTFAWLLQIKIAGFSLETGPEGMWATQAYVVMERPGLQPLDPVSKITLTS